MATATGLVDSLVVRFFSAEYCCFLVWNPEFLPGLDLCFSLGLKVLWRVLLPKPPLRGGPLSQVAPSRLRLAVTWPDSLFPESFLHCDIVQTHIHRGAPTRRQ